MGEKDYFIDLKDAGPGRMRVFVKTAKGRVVDVVVQLEIWNQGQWRAVARYDCAHGFPHIDVLKKSGAREKESLEGLSLENVVNRAVDDFKENWKVYLRRCGYGKEE